MRPNLLAILIALAALAPFSTPTPLAARDCGADYFRCLWDSGALGSSDQLHENECYGDYLACLVRALRAY